LFIFGAPYQSKASYTGSHGSLDALQGSEALGIWKIHPDANPCIRLDRSGLTVLDLDRGLHTIDEVHAWASKHGLSTGYTVTSGRAGGGFHLYYQGVRTLPEVTRNPSIGRVGFVLDGAEGDIKCHGHVVAEGGLHKSGRFYVAYGRVEDIAPLPELIRDYEDPKTIARRAQQASKIAKRVAHDMDAPTTKVPKDKRHAQLLRWGGQLRRGFGLDADALFACLQYLVQYCEESEDKTDTELRGIAEYCASQPTPFMFAETQGTRILMRPRAPQKEDEIRRALIQSCNIGEIVTTHTILVRITNILGYTPANGTLHRAMKWAKFEKAGRTPENGRIWQWIRRGELKNQELG
jgi:hypothetical protein